MQKILSTLLLMCFVYFLATAQPTMNNLAGARQTKVCKAVNVPNAPSCYITKYSSNYPVCKSESGYYICSEIPDRYNSTYLQFTGIEAYNSEPVYTPHITPVKPAPVDQRSVPMSQSYINTPAGSH